MAIAENYDEVLKGKYPAKEHARKVAKWIVEKGGDKNGTLYLEAQKLKLNEDNDGEAPFRYANSLHVENNRSSSGQSATLLFLPQWLRTARLISYLRDEY
jgi:hypothetical protein